MTPRTKITVGLTPEDLRVIDERAHDHNMSRTRFLVSVGTGRELPVSAAEDLTARLEILERQMAGACESLKVLGLPIDGAA